MSDLTPFSPWRGGAVGDRAWCVLAPNAGPMTLEGTNTWVLSEPGAGRGVVVDPGPDDAAHLSAVLEIARGRGIDIAAVLLTHGHHDHSEGARTFAAMAGGDHGPVPVRAVDPAHRLGAEGLPDGEVLDIDGLHLQVVATPGHTSDSACLLLSQEGALLTGDTVLGRGTTVVAHPDGKLGPYLASLRRLHSIAADHGLRRVMPGHGPVVDDPTAVISGYLDHRAARLDQVRAVVARGVTEPSEVVAQVYAQVDRSLWPAAELSVRAQLEYLARPGG